jgi:hypothetical protein
MKKSILNLGKALSKAEQLTISGGQLSILRCSGPRPMCTADQDCQGGFCQIPIGRNTGCCVIMHH